MELMHCSQQYHVNTPLVSADNIQRMNGVGRIILSPHFIQY